MKKKLILLPLLLSLTACSGLDLNSYLNNGNNNQNEQGSQRERTSLTPNDVAIKVLNAISIFPEVGDSIDFSEYVTFDEDFNHAISEYTFTSSNPEVIKVEGYAASCLKQGYAAISLEGPGINQPTELSFYVGSIAGTYVPDSKQIADKISFTIGEINNAEERKANFNLTIQECAYKKSNLKAYEGSGSFLKGSPFLALDFEGDNKPSGFKPVTDYLAYFGLDADLNIQSNVYGILSADPVWGVSIQTFLLDSSVVFYLQEA